ncbi:MAG TPA: peptidylprolyl isomerase [Pyrinomonadaceae bacterium]|nr:peptidylprolyl isomerase [Pyrinomonadaceae bacterium]
MLNRLSAALFLLLICFAAIAQEPTPLPGTPPKPTTPAEAPKKANARPTDAPTAQPDPFDSATVEKMRDQCVTLETEAGAIEIELMPEVAPESVRNFLNLTATGSLDTTTFSRVVKDFVIQGGNLATSERWGAELQKRASRKLPDEPGVVKHVRGIVSMARGEEANSASTHFFILVGEGSHLNGKFAAFGRVRKGMEVADAINAAPKDGDKPEKPVRINRAVVVACPAAAAP